MPPLYLQLDILIACILMLRVESRLPAYTLLASSLGAYSALSGFNDLIQITVMMLSTAVLVVNKNEKIRAIGLIFLLRSILFLWVGDEVQGYTIVNESLLLIQYLLAGIIFYGSSKGGTHIPVVRDLSLLPRRNN